MSQLIEVMFTAKGRIAGHQYPDVVEYEDGPLVRGLLRSGHAILINPPILEGYNEQEFPKRETKPAEENKANDELAYWERITKEADKKNAKRTASEE